MAIPVTIPYSFANATTTQNLSYLDANYNALANGLNGLANGTSQISISSISATGNANATTYLRGDGSWATVSGGGGSGTVTSINANSSIGFTFTGGPVTSSGTLTLSGPTPGTSGNVLTSNGTAWVSQASASGTVNSVNGFTGTVQSVVVQGTPVASTSGTSITFTGIPSWAKRVTVMFNGVGISGTSTILFQVGSGSATTTGYLGSGWITLQAASNQVTTATNGMIVNYGVAATRWNGQAVFSLLNATGNIWAGSGFLSSSTNTAVAGFSTTVPLSGSLDRVIITTSNGTDTFAAGSINILWE